MSDISQIAPSLEQSMRSWLLNGRLTGTLRNLIPALVLIVLVLVAWEILVDVFEIESFLLPKPTVIARALQENFRTIIDAALFTLRAALGGFLLGMLGGILIALVTGRWAVISRGLMIMAIMVNSTPIIALAPIMNNWFGITNPLSKMSIVALIVFFPVMINTVRGLTLVEEDALELMRSYAASEFTILRKLRFPNALPYIMSAFKVASTLSIIAAIVAEYFGGPREALGVFISQQAALFHFAEAWAAILIACGMGISFYLLILVLERIIMPWHASVRSTDL